MSINFICGKNYQIKRLMMGWPFRVCVKIVYLVLKPLFSYKLMFSFVLPVRIACLVR